MHYLCGDKNSANASPLSNEESGLKMNPTPICWTERKTNLLSAAKTSL